MDFSKLMLPHDKANHFTYGAILAGLGSLTGHWQVGVLTCAAFAVGKEIWDRTSGKGTPDWRDLAVTLAGALPVILPLALKGH